MWGGGLDKDWGVLGFRGRRRGGFEIDVVFGSEVLGFRFYYSLETELFVFVEEIM